MDRSCRLSASQTFSGSLGSNQPNFGRMQKMVESPGSITSSSHAGYYIIGFFPSFFFQQLLSALFADHRLKTSHHIRIRVRSHCRPDDIISIRGVTTPVADRFVGGIFQRFIATFNSYHLRSQHLHFFNIRLLPDHIGRSHINDTFHIHQGTYSSRRYSVLPGSGFGNDPLLSHTPGQ